MPIQWFTPFPLSSNLSYIFFHYRDLELILRFFLLFLDRKQPIPKKSFTRKAQAAEKLAALSIAHQHGAPAEDIWRLWDGAATFGLTAA